VEIIDVRAAVVRRREVRRPGLGFWRASTFAVLSGAMTITQRIKRGRQLGLLLGALPLTACMATVGVKGVSIPADAAQTCSQHCQTIGMRLSAVAIMADNVGCVCQQASEPKASSEAVGELTMPAAGMATIVMQQAAAQQQQQQQQQQRRN
jgi:hypothetical protein